MRSSAFVILAALLSVAAAPAMAAADSLTVANYQGGPDHAGHSVVPGLTWAAAPTAHLTPGFAGQVHGYTLAQPLHWHPAGSASGLIIVATSVDLVQALDPTTGGSSGSARSAPACPAPACCAAAPALGASMARR